VTANILYPSDSTLSFFFVLFASRLTSEDVRAYTFPAWDKSKKETACSQTSQPTRCYTETVSRRVWAHLDSLQVRSDAALFSGLS
jgi:hypothetical protein